jgi:hypothetical protein
MTLGSVILSETPCCQVKVRLTVDGPLRWRRLCTNCRKDYVVTIVEGKPSWKESPRRRR